ncbi:MAG: phytanoyl-CoA dioxygenase family protein [Roseibium sp.]|uniref:phytanoyl-CoA dioxygenase family protein n=1 Tax=Roseibium sp. TaxID=1936156 RepID=UPI00260920C6|nr:phytanoyl-CoA dioxygenase family protein [Roseibium sp.]MCV0425355.1 phytanoyl-CoA dioxygenase family protein [Roseibium sp.]
MDLQANLGGYFDLASCDIEEFKQLIDQRLEEGEVPHANRIEANIPIYDMEELQSVLAGGENRRRLMAEWARVLKDQSGVLVLKKAFPDTTSIDAATEIYNQIIAEEKETAGGGADHFATAGANARIWNSLEKLCLKSPEVFADYFANPAIDTVCEAWLGPNYQLTAQVNLVRPGGAAQQAHRDYHLGFQTAEICAGYPAHVHDLSPVMTLQGAVAHTGMPLISGPTKLLPYSQLYRPGYMAYRLDAFSDYFEENYVQLPLEKGDALFFNPALFHAAGANTSEDIQRMANLLQISSAFCRAMESIDRHAMSLALYPAILERVSKKKQVTPALEAAVSACAEGYSFPTNLDRDPPVGGLAPVTQKQLFLNALRESKSPAEFEKALAEQSHRRQG